MKEHLRVYGVKANLILREFEKSPSIKSSDRTFVESCSVMHKAEIQDEHMDMWQSSKKKAPHPRNPRSIRPFKTVDPHLSLLVKLIYLSHTTVRCHPIHASLFAYQDTPTASDRIHKERNRRAGPETRYRKSPNALILLCSFGMLQCPSSIHPMYATRKRAICLYPHRD